MAKVGIVMGSDSDMPVMAKASRMYFLNMQRAQRAKDLK